jgi:DNA-binding NarL/FixJ family response regulator/predicted Ser/Thr protein kinase
MSSPDDKDDREPRRLLVIAGDSQYGQWLVHRIETLRDDCNCTCADFDEFRRRRGALTLRDTDLLVLVLDFASDGASSTGLDWLRRLKDQPGLPPVLVIAENGDELSAVRALRLGATDYLPRAALTPPLLAASVDYGLRAAARLRPAFAAATAAAAAAQEQEQEPEAEEPAEDDPPPRDLIPRYALLQKLGESTRASVYLAESAALGRTVALKVTRNPDAEHSNFAHEYSAIGALRHPSIVDIFDYGVFDGREYIAMEYFPCGDLKARLQHPISVAQSLEYLRRIGQALQVVHAAGIVHRDLKPPNIMLREDGQVVLIDFGLAKNLDNPTRSTAAGVLRGSPYYMSPEQAQGITLDQRSDLYSLGVIFHEMLTGTKPYLGVTAIDVLQQHVGAAVPELPAKLADYQSILDRLMAKTREERFDDAGELLAALDETVAA